MLLGGRKELIQHELRTLILETLDPEAVRQQYYPLSTLMTMSELDFFLFLSMHRSRCQAESPHVMCQQSFHQWLAWNPSEILLTPLDILTGPVLSFL